jgi:tripartite-type tricarboxylate transporter receptor subunit TctC
MIHAVASNAARTLLVALGLMAPAAWSSAQAEYPNRQITMVVPLAPGGGSDTQARILAKFLTERFNQPVVVVNKPGANGYIGAQMVAEARPDGYTLMLQSAGSFMLAGMMRNQILDPLKDLKPVAQIGELNTSVMVRAESPHKTVGDLVAYAKSKPGSVRWSHNGRGSFHHIAGVGFSRDAGLKTRDVPFDGGGPSRAALVGGQVDYALLGIQQLSGFESQLRVLGIVGDERDELFPDVPTLKEQGIDAPTVSSPTVLYAPKTTPDATVSQIARAVEDIVRSEPYRKELAKIGLSSSYRGPEATAAYLTKLHESWMPLVKEVKSAPQ